jgi:hypothetical protein
MKLWMICLMIVAISAFRQGHITKTVTQNCNITIRGCTDCNPLDASKCHMCDFNFTLNTNNYTCDCQQHYFLNSKQTQCLVCIDLFGRNCMNCSSSAFPENSTYCVECNPGFYWNAHSCCSNALPNCSNCSFDGSVCFECTNNSYLIDGHCYSCQLECLICDNVTCTQCKDTQTYL